MGWRAAARLGQPETVSLPTSQQTAFWGAKQARSRRGGLFAGCSTVLLRATGALLFIASDSMIALDKFYSPIPQCKLLVRCDVASTGAASSCLTGSSGWVACWLSR
jgi:hypothetical protein